MKNTTVLVTNPNATSLENDLASYLNKSTRNVHFTVTYNITSNSWSVRVYNQKLCCEPKGKLTLILQIHCLGAVLERRIVETLYLDSICFQVAILESVLFCAIQAVLDGTNTNASALVECWAGCVTAESDEWCGNLYRFNKPSRFYSIVP